MLRTYITIEQAMAHLRVDSDISSDDGDLLSKMDQACDIVLDYLEMPEDSYAPGSESDGAPPRIISATLLVLGELYKNREAQSDPLSQGVWRILNRLRVPVQS